MAMVRYMSRVFTPSPVIRRVKRLVCDLSAAMFVRRLVAKPLSQRSAAAAAGIQGQDLLAFRRLLFFAR
jgi:hypothetical protein